LSNKFIKFVPTNPAPPVTKMFFLDLDIKVFLYSYLG